MQNKENDNLIVSVFVNKSFVAKYFSSITESSLQENRCRLALFKRVDAIPKQINLIIASISYDRTLSHMVLTRGSTFRSLSYKRYELWIHRPIHIDQCYVNSTAGGTPRPVRNRLKSTTVKHAVRNDWSSYSCNCNYRLIWIFPIRFYTIFSKRCRVWYSNLWQSYSIFLLIQSVVNFRSFGRNEYTRDFTPYDDSHRLIFQRSSFYGFLYLVDRS